MVAPKRPVRDAGTSLASNRHVPEHDRGPHGEAWRGRRNLYFLAEAQSMGPLLWVLGGAVHVAVLGVFLHAGYPAWRLIAVGVLFVSLVCAQRMTVRKARDPSCVEGAFIAINVVAQVFVVGATALTGGVHSPFLPNVVLPAIVSLLFFGPIAASRWIALGNGWLIVAMVALPSSMTGPALPDADYTIAVLLALGWALFMLHRLAGKLSVAAARASDSYDCLREERVAEAEAQLRRLQSVGAKVAHELKNPLAAIKGLCQLVARAPDSERTQERLAVVAAEIGRMEAILHGYLSFSRPLEDLHPEPIELTALGRDVLEVLAGRADQAGVTLSLDGEPTTAEGDPRRLKEALINLVANAIEATPAGGTVALHVHEAEGAVTVEVEDTGRGISPEDLERLGTSFFTTRANGTGLGVVLAQGVITQHGGKLAYDSTLGRGTTATITLPARGPAPAEATA